MYVEVCCMLLSLFFFFKQKTAYEMRISDWSSDVCSSDLAALYRSLPALRSGASDPAIRGEALYGSWLSAICLASTSMGLHHKLCHTLGGALNLPHAETHTIVLPHAIDRKSTRLNSSH